MNTFPALGKLRVGCVRYLNAKPLIAGFDGPIRLEHPAVLARLLGEGELDVALVPAYEALAIPGYRVVDEVSIASFGPVFSVFLAHTGELGEVRSVSLDPASRTSAHLIRCVLSEFHGLQPQYGEEGEAKLLIGNQAIEFRRKHQMRYLDLGEEWRRQTGLPFVYALWLIRPGVEGAKEVAEDLRALKRVGLQRVDEIAQGTEFPEFARAYLTENIRYDLNDPEKQGFWKFRDLLVRHRLLMPRCDGLEFL